MKKIFFLLIALLPSYIFASSEWRPVQNVSIGIDSLSCPYGKDYGICAWVNSNLHNTFVAAMKKYDAQSALNAWDQMSNSMDGTENNAIDNTILNPLIWAYAPEWAILLPDRILGKKAFKWGILILWDIGVQDVDFSFYYVSYIRYKRAAGVDMLTVYNTPLIPEGSKQYTSYAKVYGYSDFSSFSRDMQWSFSKGKFNNKEVNAIYQSFVKSITDIKWKTASPLKLNTKSPYYRIQNQIVQFRTFIHGVWRYEWLDTDIDAGSATFWSDTSGKDLYGSFMGGVRLKMNGKNVSFSPIVVKNDFYWKDGSTDSVYILGEGYGPLEKLIWAKASTLIVLDTLIFLERGNKYCKVDDSNTFESVSALDKGSCYGTYGSAPGNLITKIAERI